MYYSGYFFQDFWMGLELNPRSFAGLWDHKYFSEGRPGLIGWVLISISIAAKQYTTEGALSWPMLLSVSFFVMYILDCMIFEPALCNTLDIYYDRFGFMLCFGDLVWVPYTYSIVSYKILLLSPNFPSWVLVLLVVLNTIGLVLFRGSNLQKHLFRMHPEKWGNSFKSMPTKEGGKLMCGGFWGISRHSNYAGDLTMGFTWCLTGGIDRLVNWFYIIYFTILLVHRAQRDDLRCSEKYGEDWKTYCKKVPYRIFPLIY